MMEKFEQVLDLNHSEHENSRCVKICLIKLRCLFIFIAAITFLAQMFLMLIREMLKNEKLTESLIEYLKITNQNNSILYFNKTENREY